MHIENFWMQKVRIIAKQTILNLGLPFFGFKHRKLCLNPITKHTLRILISAIWIPILSINSPMVSKSIAIAYSYTKQHRKKMKRIIPILSFTIRETKKKKKRERYMKCPDRWLSSSNLMQAIFIVWKH